MLRGPVNDCSPHAMRNATLVHLHQRCHMCTGPWALRLAGFFLRRVAQRRDNFEPASRRQVAGVTVIVGLRKHSQFPPLSDRLTARRRLLPIVVAGAALVCVAVLLLAASSAPAADFTLSEPALVTSPSAPVSSLSCPTITRCVGVSGGSVYATTPPDNRWVSSLVDTTSTFVVISCWPGSSCVAIDAAGFVYFTGNPPASRWLRSKYSIDTAAQITGLSCLAGGCVAVDARGSVLTEADTSGSETAAIGAWHTTSYVGRGDGSYDSLNSVSCTPTFCLVGNAHGWLFAQQATHGGAWTVGPGVRVGYDVSTVSCLPDGQCVVSGPNETSTDEGLDVFGGSSAWTTHWNSDPLSYPQPTAVSCASDTLCVGVNNARIGLGYAIVSTHPVFPGSFTGPAATDTAIDAPGSGGLIAVSCAAGTDNFTGYQACAVADATGHLITGTYTPDAPHAAH
jgi:hypothetical protein